MKIKMIILLLVVSFVTLYSQQYVFVFENRTSVTLNELYCEPVGVEWGYNYLGYDLEPGQSFKLSVESQDGECIYDFFAIGKDGQSYINMEQNLCESDLIIMTDVNREEENSVENNEDNYDDETMIDGDIHDVITYNTWRMIFNGEEYGTIDLKTDGTVIKTQDGNSDSSIGTWSLDDTGSNLTLDFPEEGPAMTGKLTYRGNEMDLVFMDGALKWKLLAK